MRFGEYEIFEPIAAGGMAEVYRARALGEEGFEKPVVIKRILPQFASDARMVHMLVQEARIHAALAHRNIVQIHDLGQSTGGEYFIVLEHVDGHDLGAVLEALARRSPPDNRMRDPVALFVAAELAEGVHFAHELVGPDGQPAGLVHRDISPSNVLISYAGEVKLSDFGLAKRLSDQSLIGSLKGKLAYMSPEQARRWPLDRRSDIFSLGAVLFELLTGKRLRQIVDETEGFRLVASGVMATPRSARPEIPAVLEQLLQRALSPNPQDRFADAQQFAAAARAALARMPRGGQGELAELRALIRELLPPGAPRPPTVPSRVIRIQSEFLDAGPGPVSLRPAGPGVVGPASPRATPPPPPLEVAIDTSGLDEERGARRSTPPPPRRRSAVPLPGMPALRAPAVDPPAPSGAPGAGIGGVVRDMMKETVPATVRVAPRPAPLAETSAAMNNLAATVSLRGPRARVATPLHGPDPRPPAGRRDEPLETPRLGTPSAVEPIPVRRGRAGPRLVLLFVLLVVGGLAAAHELLAPLPVLVSWWSPASLRIDSRPIGAEVTLDGVTLLEPTPLTVPVRRDRQEHVIELERPGYVRARVPVRYDRSVLLAVEVDLQESDPPFARRLPEGTAQDTPAEAAPSSESERPAGDGSTIDVRSRSAAQENAHHGVREPRSVDGKRRPARLRRDRGKRR